MDKGEAEKKDNEEDGSNSAPSNNDRSNSKEGDRERNKAKGKTGAEKNRR